jgi:hypothetical protein
VPLARVPFAFVALTLALPACEEPCAGSDPILELELPNELVAGEPLVGFMRADALHWSPFLCDPQQTFPLAGVPRWEGSCDLIALAIVEPEMDTEIEVELIDLHGRSGTGSLLVEAKLCERVPVSTQITLEDAAPQDAAAACADACHMYELCEDPGFDYGACTIECVTYIEDPDSPCALERLSVARCEARRGCSWRPPEHHADASPCQPVDEALAACEAGL